MTYRERADKLNAELEQCEGPSNDRVLIVESVISEGCHEQTLRR